MKKIILGLLFGCGLLIGLSEAARYVPTQEDGELVAKIEERLNSIIGSSNSKRWDYVHQLIVLTDNFGQDDRVNYLLTTIKDIVYQPLVDEKKKTEIAKNMMEKSFYAEHGRAIYSTDFDVPTGCFDHYDYIDTLSWLYDHPTSLTLATWFREANCRQEGTHNAQGPFQITTHHYGYDEMDEGEFLKAVQEYLIFSKEKYDRYTRANGGKLEVEIGYNNRSLSGVVYHGALYNGLGGRNIKGVLYPAATGYVYGNFNEEYAEYSRDGVLTMMLKVIEANEFE